MYKSFCLAVDAFAACGWDLCVRGERASRCPRSATKPQRTSELKGCFLIAQFRDIMTVTIHQLTNWERVCGHQNWQQQVSHESSAPVMQTAIRLYRYKMYGVSRLVTYEFPVIPTGLVVLSEVPVAARADCGIATSNCWPGATPSGIVTSTGGIGPSPSGSTLSWSPGPIPGTQRVGVMNAAQ